MDDGLGVLERIPANKVPLIKVYRQGVQALCMGWRDAKAVQGDIYPPTPSSSIDKRAFVNGSRMSADLFCQPAVLYSARQPS